MVDTEITLIKPAGREQDATGVWRNTGETRRPEILARMDDASRAEFFAAGQDGMRAEFRFTLNSIEYDNEPICEWNGQRYVIYRHYHVPGTDELELYVQREVGVHG